jgi:hypothetical protein
MDDLPGWQRQVIGARSSGLVSERQGLQLPSQPTIAVNQRAPADPDMPSLINLDGCAPGQVCGQYTQGTGVPSGAFRILKCVLKQGPEAGWDTEGPVDAPQRPEIGA